MSLNRFHQSGMSTINWQQKAYSAASFLLRVSLPPEEEKRKWEARSLVMESSKQWKSYKATLHFMSALRISPQIERIVQINALRFVTKEVVEVARERLVIGLGT